MRVAAMLLERDDALGAVDLVVRSIRDGHGRALFVVGPSGIGKSSILLAARDAAGDDVRVISARGAAWEADLPFALAEQVMGPLIAPAGGGDFDGSAERAQVFGLVRRWMRSLSTATPTLILIDDLHWSDLDSIDLVGFVARRLGALPVGLIAALRPWPPAALDMVDVAATEPGVEALGLDQLSPASASELLSTLAGFTLTPAMAERGWRLAGGNPQLAQEAARILRSDRDLPDSGDQDSTATHQALLLSHFGGLPHQALACAQAAAVVGKTARLSAIRAVSGLSDTDFAVGYDTLASADTLGRGHDGPAEFRHDLLADAVYSDIPPAKRQLLHRRAFDFYGALDACDDAAPHAVAAELVGDGAAITVVCDAGTRALQAGAVASGLGLLAAGVELAGPQPPISLVAGYADALFATGRPDQAAAIYQSLVDRDPSDAAVDLLMKLARAQVYSGAFDIGVNSFSRLLDGSLDLGPAMLPTILERSHACWERDGPAAGLAALEGDLNRHPELRGVPLVAGIRGFLRLQTGDTSALADIDALASSISFRPSFGPEQMLASFMAAQIVVPAWAITNRIEEALELIDETCGWLWSSGQLRGMGPQRVSRLGILLSQGKLAVVVAEAEDLQDELDLDALLAPHVWIFQARALADMGRGADAEALCRQSKKSPGIKSWFTQCNLAATRGQILFHAGRIDAAAHTFRQVEDLVDRYGAGVADHPVWAADAIEAHLAAGRLDDAARVVAWVEARGQPPLGLQCAAVIAAGGRAEVAAQRGHHDDAERWYRSALAEPCRYPLDRARIQVRYGEWLRRRHKDLQARPVLADAARTAERCGAVPLAQRAAAELAAAGGRRRRRRDPAGRLTAQEARTVELAVTGATVREIATEMHLSPRTVESHLAHVYDKFGVGSKQELRRRRHELLEATFHHRSAPSA